MNWLRKLCHDVAWVSLAVASQQWHSCGWHQTNPPLRRSYILKTLHLYIRWEKKMGKENVKQKRYSKEVNCLGPCRMLVAFPAPSSELYKVILPPLLQPISPEKLSENKYLVHWIQFILVPLLQWVTALCSEQNLKACLQHCNWEWCFLDLSISPQTPYTN